MYLSREAEPCTAQSKMTDSTKPRRLFADKDAAWAALHRIKGDTNIVIVEQT